MKHLILIPSNVDTWNALSAAEIEAIMRAHASLQKELRASGEFVEAHELGEEAKFVTSDGDSCTVTDGPFMETKEFLAGLLHRRLCGHGTRGGNRRQAGGVNTMADRDTPNQPITQKPEGTRSAPGPRT